MVNRMCGACAVAAIMLFAVVGCSASKSSATVEDASADSGLAAAHPKAFVRGQEDGEKAGRAWGGDDLPGMIGLESMAKTAAEKAIPSNTALIGSGSDEERFAYAEAFVDKFSQAYKNERPLRLSRAGQRGSDDGHQAGFLVAKTGRREPEKDQVAAVASKQAEELIPSDVSLPGAGSSQERKEYIKGFLSQFSVGYRKGSILRRLAQNQEDIPCGICSHFWWPCRQP